MLKILLRHTEHIARVCKKHIAPFLILGHIWVLALLEVVQFSIVVTLYPTGFIQMHGLPTALGVVLVL
jgi:hypothetical protein